MLERLFCIRPSEKKNVLFFSLLAFAWSISVSFGVAYSDILLIESVGSQSLPFAFIITSFGLFAFSGILLYFYNRRSIHQIYYLWAGISAALYFLAFVALSLGINSKMFFIFFKAFCYIIQIGFYSCYWTFIDQYFELQNAKRLFGIFYSAIFLGTAVSGAVMTFFTSSVQSPWIVLAITVFPIVCSGLIVRLINKDLKKLPDDFEQFVVIKTRTKDLVKSIVTSPFTLLLLLFCVLLQILLVITEYEYMFNLQSIFVHSSDKGLTEFLGELYFFGGIFNILFGFFIYGRLIKKAGLHNALLLVPVFFTSLFFGWAFSNHIFLTVMGFIAVEGVLTLVEDNNFTLLLNAVPLKLKSKIRIISESLIEPLGILLSSGLILLFQQHSKVLGLCLSLLMLGVGLLMRAYYTKGIFYNLVSHLINFQKPKHSWETQVERKDYQRSKQKFLQQFLSLKTREQLFIFECGLRFNDRRFLHILMGKITKLPSSVKLLFLEILDDHPNDVSKQFQPYFQYWIKKDPSLYKFLIFHLAKMDLIARDQILDTQCPYSRASMALIQSGANSSVDSEQLLQAMLMSDDETENKVAIEAVRFSKIGNYTPTLMDLLEKKPLLRESILKTLSTTLDQRNKHLLPVFLSELESENQRSTRYLLVDCIEKTLDHSNLKTVLLQTINWKEPEKRDLERTILNMSIESIPILVDVLECDAYPDKTRLFSGQILAKLDKKMLKSSFDKICSQEIKKAYLYHYHYITIQKSYPFSILNLLEQALNHSLNSILDFIIQMQAHIQDFEQGEILTQSIHSSNPKTYSQAQETLQKMCSRKVYTQIRPLVEESHEKEFFKSYHELKLPVLSLEKLLDLLEKSSSKVNRMIVFSLKDRLNIPLPAQEITVKPDNSSIQETALK